MDANSQISLLNMASIFVAFLILICILIYFLLSNKKAKKIDRSSGQDKISEDENQEEAEKKNQGYGRFQGVLTRESIKDFMEFDEVVDNMIVRKKG